MLKLQLHCGSWDYLCVYLWQDVTALSNRRQRGSSSLPRENRHKFRLVLLGGWQFVLICSSAGVVTVRIEVQILCSVCVVTVCLYAHTTTNPHNMYCTGDTEYSVTHLAATQHVPLQFHLGLTRKFSPSGKSRYWVVFVTLNVQSILPHGGK